MCVVFCECMYVCIVQPHLESALSSPLAALAQVSQQLEARDATALGLPGWDLQQLALYLLVSKLLSLSCCLLHFAFSIIFFNLWACC